MQIKGVLLESKYPEYRFVVKGPMQKVWKDGFPLDEQKILTLEFDRFICEIDQIAAEQEWTAADIEAVEGTLTRYLKDPTFRDMWVHEAPKPSIPWPTYNETPEAQIGVVAQATGMIDAALSYETRGREPRDKVVKKLQELQAARDESSDVVSDDLAAV